MRFAIDAVSLTLRKGTALDIQGAVERGLIQRTTWEDMGLGWETKPMGYNGWAAIHTYGGGDITLLEGKGFVCMQMKSRACTVCQDRLARFFSEAADACDAVATRLDGVWHPVPWHPSEFLERLRSPQLVSKQKKHGAGWIESDDGATASLPPYSHRKGAPRFLRLYNARGYNRLELQLNKPDADSCFQRMNKVDQNEWTRVFARYLLRSVDFREGPQKVVTQRKRSPWFAEFVGDLKKAI